MKHRAISKEEAFAMKTYGLDVANMDGCTSCLFQRGEKIFTQGVQEKALYIVLKGKVRVSFLASNGEQLNLCYYSSEGILGEVEFMLGNISATATSVVVAPTVCIAIPLRQHEKSLRDNAVFMNEVARGLSTKLLNSNQAHVSSALYTAQERLCTYILVTQQGGVFGESLKEVAQFTGISYRNVCRILKQLCQAGVLEKRNCGYVILEEAYLLKNGIGEGDLARA